MKKILSIMLALGLVLGMVVAAVPAAAQPAGDWTVVSFVSDEYCELKTASYNITLAPLPASLTQGYHTVTVKFPAGTGYPASYTAGSIRIGGADVFASEITRVGDEITFLVPTTILSGPVLIEFRSIGTRRFTNPPAGKYNVEVKTSRAPMSTWVKSQYNAVTLKYDPYTIVPTVSTYKWVLDFDQIGGYEDIGLNVVPPFQMCGQETIGFVDPLIAGRYVTPFDLLLRASPAGCAGCPLMAAEMIMTARPTTTARAHLYDASAQTVAKNFTSTDPLVAGSTYALGSWDPLPANPTDTWDFGLHFDTPGTYTFCFVLEYSGTGVCELGCADVTRCVDFVVYQEKDSFKIDPFTQKWNFFSSPLVLKDGDIEVVLGAILDQPVPQLKHVVHYDNALGKWFGFFPGSSLPAGYQSLTTIEDGKAYAVRMKATYEGFSSTYVPYLWLFGNEAPEFPAPPLSYQVYEGWTMMGFTSTAAMDFEDYLYPSLVGDGAAWHFGFLSSGDNMNPGEGYWVYFDADGTVVPGVSP